MSEASKDAEDRSQWSGIVKDKGKITLALIITGAAFMLIGVMLVMEYSITSSALDQMNNVTDPTKGKEFRENVEKLQQSNISVFNILLPVFGAWVGAVVAFYFGAENLKTAQATISKLAGTKEERLAKITVKELLDDYPAAKNVISATMDDTMDKINEKLNSDTIKGGPLTILDAQQKPIGMLYKGHLFDAISAEKLTSSDLKSPNVQLGNVINGVKDFITGKNWTATGVENFAKLKLTDILLLAQSRMYAISDHSAVRGLVIENEKVTAIVDHEMISSKVK